MWSSRIIVRSGALLIEVKKPLQDIIVAEIVWPAIGVGDGVVQRAVGVVQPSRAFIIEIGQRALLELLELFFGEIVARQDTVGIAGHDLGHTHRPVRRI